MKYVSHIAWLFLVISAFFIGRYTSEPTQVSTLNDMTVNNEASLQNDASNLGNASKNEGEIVSSPNNKETNKSFPQGKATLNQIFSEFYQLQQGKSWQDMDIEGMLRFHIAIKSLNEEELVQALSHLDDNASQSLTMAALSGIAKRLAEINPENALTSIETRIASKNLKAAALQYVVSEWSKQDPESALVWHNNVTVEDMSGREKDSHNYMLSRIFSGLAKKDLDLAIEKLDDYSENSRIFNMVTSGISQNLTTESDRLYFLNQTEKYNNPRIKHNVVSSWFRDEPQQVLAWVEGLDEGQDPKGTKERIFQQWSYQEPKKAADWFLSTANTNDREENISKIASNWGSINAQEALDWVANQGQTSTSGAVKAVFQSAQYSDPNFVINNMDKLANIKDQKDISISLLQNLYRNNKAKAMEFINNSKFKTELLDVINQIEANHTP